MSSDDDFLAGSCFWYYAAITSALVILGWAVFLPGYNSREKNPNKDQSELGWPSNLNMWEYNVHSLIPFLLWTASLLILMWGAYHADCQDNPVSSILIYRTIFLIIAILSLLSLFLFYIAHNLIWALIFNIIALSLVITLIVMYSTVHTDDAWLAYPYLLILSYHIYMIWYALLSNPNNPSIRNSRFWF
jgi:hypothetical protein